MGESSLSDMAPMRRTVVRVGCFVLVIIVLSNFHNVLTMFMRVFGLSNALLGASYSEKEIHDNLSLGEVQCRTTFPGLMKEIDDAVARGSFTLERQPDDYTGQVQARIKDGKLYVISADDRPTRDMLFQRNSVLHQIHRALITSPTPMPDTVFIFSTNDNPREGAWSFSRSSDPNIRGNYWVMPHFSYWGWPLPFIGSIDEALTKIDIVEKDSPWEKKIDKVVWRGTAWFNSAGNNNLRPHMLAATKEKDWADVETLEWDTNAEHAKNAIAIHDFCKYKYIIYTEGITYSGRLPYHQACGSVILTPPPNYLLHNTHLLKPLLSASLPFSLSYGSKTGAGNNPRWPKSYPPSEANIIFLDPDWADLEETVMWLRAHPDVAQGIAKRQSKMNLKAGFLSQASEVCYWRALIRGWATVARTDEEVWANSSVNGKGMRWETFALTGRTYW